MKTATENGQVLGIKGAYDANDAYDSTDAEDFKPLTAEEVRPGDMVIHPQFGSGLIVSIAGSLATIAFKRSGVKKMMLGVAPLTKA